MLIRVHAMGKRYEGRRGHVDALRDVDLDIERGTFVTVTGPSGAGKSTLLLALAGLLRPTSGEIWFRELPLHDLSQAALAAYRRTHVGFVMQDFSLIPYLSAERNVMIPLALGGHSRATARSRARALLDRVGLAQRAAHLPRELSIGQQQRVASARALANDPPVILADEPTGNLDPALTTDILDLLTTVGRERDLTTLMVTHSPQAAARGDRRVHIEDGRLASTPTASAPVAC